jgi:hypothetical protein
MIWLYLLDWRTWALAGVALMAIALGVQTTRVSLLKSEMAQAEAERLKAAEAWKEKISALERKHAEEQQRVNDDFAKDKAALIDYADRLAGDGERLRQQVADGLARADADSAQCKRKGDLARTYGKLFGLADRAAEKLARDADQRNAEVRLLKSQITIDRKACDG